MLLLRDPRASNKNGRGGGGGWAEKALESHRVFDVLIYIDGRDETRADSMTGCWALGWQGLGVRIWTLGEVFWEPLHVSARVPSQAVGRVTCGLCTADGPRYHPVPAGCVPRGSGCPLDTSGVGVATDQ